MWWDVLHLLWFFGPAGIWSVTPLVWGWHQLKSPETASGWRWLQWCHPQTRDVTILSSCFHLANILWVETLYFLCANQSQLSLFWRHSDFPAFFERVTQDRQVDTRFCVNLWPIKRRHIILCHPLAYYRETPRWAVHVRTMEIKVQASAQGDNSPYTVVFDIMMQFYNS